MDAVLERPLDVCRRLRLGLDRRRALGLADASLRPLGLQARTVLLDSGPPLGTRLGGVGHRTGLRRLGAARLRRPPARLDPYRLLDRLARLDVPARRSLPHARRRRQRRASPPAPARPVAPPSGRSDPSPAYPHDAAPPSGAGRPPPGSRAPSPRRP